MDTCKLLSYVIVAIIIALVLHLVTKLLKKPVEGMTGVKASTCRVGKLMNATTDGVNVMHPALNFPDRITKPSEPVKLPVTPVIEGMSDVSAPKEVVSTDSSNLSGSVKGKDCTICDTSKYVDDYVRESLLHRALVCRDKETYSPEEVNKHRDEVLAFRNSVNQTSNSDDLVDRINELYLSGSNDLSRNHHNVRIGDLFDQLTAGQSIYSQGCARLPPKEATLNEGEYLVSGHSGNFYPSDQWVYGEERVINGGEFMSGVWPSDAKGEQNQAV